MDFSADEIAGMVETIAETGSVNLHKNCEFWTTEEFCSAACMEVGCLRDKWLRLPADVRLERT